MFDPISAPCRAVLCQIVQILANMCSRVVNISAPGDTFFRGVVVRISGRVVRLCLLCFVDDRVGCVQATMITFELIENVFWIRVRL